MKKIALVTDSTADINPEIQKKHNINIIPLNVVFENEVLKDNEFSAAEFYQRLPKEKVLPKTSQPSPQEFENLYTNLLEKFDEIISIHISSALSGTINSAQIAQEKFKNKIHIFDSKNISLGAAFLLVEASECIKKKFTAPEIMRHLDKVRKGIETYFTLDTMEYLHKGGRIGKASSLLGSVLNIKPIIRVNEEGIYVPAGKVRSQKAAMLKIQSIYQELASIKKPLRLGIAHGACEEGAQKLKALLEKHLNIPATIFTQVGAVIGVHTGPGTLGACVQFES